MKSATMAEELPRLISERARVHTLQDLLTVIQLDKQGAMNRRLVRKLQDGTLGQTDSNTEGDEMGGNYTIGDTYNVTSPPPPVVEQKKSPGISWKWLVPILLAAMGIGGLGAAALLPSAKGPVEQPTEIQQPADQSDQDTRYNLRFIEPNSGT